MPQRPATPARAIRGFLSACVLAAGASKVAGSEAILLPHYEAPESYRVDLVIESPEAPHMVLHRFIDRGRIRTEFSGGEQDMVMIEMGDEKGTSLMLMPGDKRAIRQSRAALESMPGAKKRLAEAGRDGAPAPPPDMKVEDLGMETRDGRTLKKLRIGVPEGTSLGWFDPTTGAPVRMESTMNGKPVAIDWKEYKVGPQPAKLFEVPKGYELTDMDEMMAKLKSMGGMGTGMESMMGGMGMKNMMGGMGANLGSSMGASLGSSLGAAFGGPLGAIAGQYLGGKVGGMVGRKAVETVTPGK